MPYLSTARLSQNEKYYCSALSLLVANPPPPPVVLFYKYHGSSSRDAAPARWAPGDSLIDPRITPKFKLGPRYNKWCGGRKEGWDGVKCPMLPCRHNGDAGGATWKSSSTVSCSQHAPRLLMEWCAMFLELCYQSSVRTSPGA